MGKRLHIQLLGSFSLKSGNRSITTINTPRLQALLAFLLLNRKSPQSRTTLAYLFWPDSNDVQARTNLRNLIHLLGQALPDADRFLRKDTHTLQWRLDAPCELDVDHFEKAITQAGQMQAVGDISGTLSKLEHGIAIYRSDLLPNCYTDWII
jgi:DNA-binding SARP family transcriptional activator